MTGAPEAESQGAIEQAIAFLEGTGQYRVLRKLADKVAYYIKDGRPLKLAVFLDLETTGLDPVSDEVIEICAVPFSYSEDGYIFDVYPAFSGMQQPSRPIPPEVVKLTGITDEMVAGKSINLTELRNLLTNVELVVAHNASFDRRFAEKLSDAFVFKM